MLWVQAFSGTAVGYLHNNSGIRSDDDPNLENMSCRCFTSSLVLQVSGRPLTIYTPVWGNSNNRSHGPLNRHEILPVAHAPGLPGTFSPPPTSRKPLVSDPGMHHGTCVTHVSWFVSGSLTRIDGENVPDIPGACRTQTFAYLVRGPCSVARTMTIYWMGWYKYINSAWQWEQVQFIDALHQN